MALLGSIVIILACVSNHTNSFVLAAELEHIHSYKLFEAFTQ